MTLLLYVSTGPNVKFNWRLVMILLLDWWGIINPPELFISQGYGARIWQSGLRENQIPARRLEQYDQNFDELLAAAGRPLCIFVGNFYG